MSVRPVVLALGAAVIIAVTACLPYNIANTAQTVPVGEHQTTTTLWFMPNGIGLRDSALSKPHTLRGVDSETRWGIDDESDFGIRIPSGSGVVASYKRRIAGYPHADSAAMAWQLGAGFVNVGEHAMGEFSVLASGPKRSGVAWYGGARVMQTAPLSEGAVHDLPSIGALIGARISVGDETILPELAVYHDPSALGIRKGDIIYVPSFSVRGTSLLRGLGGLARLCVAGATR